ncbi:hypothetical protein B0H10DRAFT_1953571 [Mycena sp. CBHHK59/15]|nr:hypothetical protein B0H10DRAFT_1953571 [Mycena sp. CBHHK59/15]
MPAKSGSIPTSNLAPVSSFSVVPVLGGKDGIPVVIVVMMTIFAERHMSRQSGWSSSLPTMSFPYYCNPPFHPDPGYNPTVSSGRVWLATSQACLSPSAGIFASWESCMAASEWRGPGSGSVAYVSCQACLPAWHASCALDEHSHPVDPYLQPAPVYSLALPASLSCATCLHIHHGSIVLWEPSPAPAPTSTAWPVVWIADNSPGPPSPTSLMSSMPMLLSPITEYNTQPTTNTCEHYTIRRASMCTTCDIAFANYFATSHDYPTAEAMADNHHSSDPGEPWYLERKE